MKLHEQTDLVFWLWALAAVLVVGMLVMSVWR